MRKTFLPYCRPHVDEGDVASVVDALRNHWLTTGPKARAFEDRFAELTGARHAVGLNSATAGIHLALVALGVGPGDEVVLPSLSFVSAANCVRHCGALPVFCDVEPDTLCLSVRSVDAVVTERTKVVVSMPYSGRPVGIGALRAYTRGRGIALIEDAALGVGTLDAGRWPGSESDAAIFSFYATKNLTTGEGGMLVTNDDDLADRVRRLALHGMDRDAWKRYAAGGTWRYDVTMTGYKYNLPDMAAALGLAQLDKLAVMQERRAQIAARYCEAIASIAGIGVAALGRMGSLDRHSWCFFPIAVDEGAGLSRDEVVVAMREANIGTSVHYIPSHLFTAYAQGDHDLPNTEQAWAQLISLPLFPSMSDQDVEDVLEALAGAVERVSASVA
ncbi:MAG TPA: DegT/DnrJ/EryC1/StrS family aminotransferase [Candidatus Limnocylindria bacterium]|nr:DegT/DnrJ/EryC1/StrS family aminotransferase [Candidatus Limnocylindria bacterium]